MFIVRATFKIEPRKYDYFYGDYGIVWKYVSSTRFNRDVSRINPKKSHER